MSTPPYGKTLGEREGKVACQLLGGHAPSIAMAVMCMEDVKECLYDLFISTINDECNKICQCSVISVFRNMSMNQAVDFKWSLLIIELKSKSPLVYSVLSSVVTRDDCRNTIKVRDSHNPGICMLAGVILKERNGEMCSLQSILSLLMYSCHCEKRV